MSAYSIIKYPRTPHLQGSRLQPGDEDLQQIPFSEIAGKNLVVEEKCDGANSAVSFDTDGTLMLQSRGHYLTGGYREKHYDLLKQWANVHRDALYDLLGSRYIMYGEWMYAKHTVFYNALPHYFLEFDILDRQTQCFLDTPLRRRMLADFPVVSAPALYQGTLSSLDKLIALLGRSNYSNGENMDMLRTQCETLALNANEICGETDCTGIMEGLYVKVEANGKVVDRVKYVRASFLQNVRASQAHWLERPIVPNLLRYPLESLFTPSLPEADRHVQ